MCEKAASFDVLVFSDMNPGNGFIHRLLLSCLPGSKWKKKVVDGWGSPFAPAYAWVWQDSRGIQSYCQGMIGVSILLETAQFFSVP